MFAFDLQGAGDEMVKPVKVKTVFNKVNSNDYGQAKFTGNLTDFFFHSLSSQGHVTIKRHFFPRFSFWQALCFYEEIR